MSSARDVRRKYHALHEKLLDELLVGSPSLDRVDALRNAIAADSKLRQSFETQENEFARARRRRSLVTTAQILVILITVGAAVAAGASLVLHPTLFAGLGVGTALTTAVGLMVWTWRRAFHDGTESEAKAPKAQQLVLDLVDARRQRHVT